MGSHPRARPSRNRFCHAAQHGRGHSATFSSATPTYGSSSAQWSRRRVRNELNGPTNHGAFGKMSQHENTITTKSRQPPLPLVNNQTVRRSRLWGGCLAFPGTPPRPSPANHSLGKGDVRPSLKRTLGANPGFWGLRPLDNNLKQ